MLYRLELNLRWQLKLWTLKLFSIHAYYLQSLNDSSVQFVGVAGLEPTRHAPKARRLPLNLIPRIKSYRLIRTHLYCYQVCEVLYHSVSGTLFPILISLYFDILLDKPLSISYILYVWDSLTFTGLPYSTYGSLHPGIKIILLWISFIHYSNISLITIIQQQL